MPKLIDKKMLLFYEICCPFCEFKVKMYYFIRHIYECEHSFNNMTAIFAVQDLYYKNIQKRYHKYVTLSKCKKFRLKIKLIPL